MNYRVVLGLGLAALAALMGLVVLAGGATGAVAEQATLSTLVNMASCQSTGTIVTLDPEQSVNAETIVSVTAAASGESAQAEQIALMVAITESGLRDLGNTRVPGSNTGEGMGQDGTSVGLFQQQTQDGWGTVSEESNPADATGMFVQRLLSVSDWQTKKPWRVAEEVQGSRFVRGSNYKAHWLEAGVVLADVTGSFTVAGCGAGPTGGVTGPASSDGLPAGYAIPLGTTPQASLAITYALSKLGDRYVWGAAGPNAFDCSGLTMMAWAQAGVTLDHYTVDQMNEGQMVAAGAMAPGDLVFVPGTDAPGPGLPGHVGIYLGDGLVESAVDPQMGVVVQSWTAFTAGGLDAIVNPAT
ncbi:C40 family peptidase [Ferrimicrobium sp.]|uniref:C40 family peptidase n=1 Tax=Ferrimicrobium sp. TaxID=2926050 RepID=UPI002604EAB9|nr:C40 family peptidase [Ferrimicrobium sp.]